MKPVIYQLVVRYFGNTAGANAVDGDIRTNGCGKFQDINARALAELKDLGVTHIWLTGVLRQATLTDYGDHGLPADPPEIVKGRAGSFYAVRDYCDVCPDYAVDPAKRMDEFESLLQRIQAADLQVLIDLVPNHVSRNYSSAHPFCDFGAGDDQSRFFDPQNNFFYLVDPPGQALSLPKPEHWHPQGVVFQGSFPREDGSLGRVPKATGDNVTVPWPGPRSWYEAVKLNYGYDFVRCVGAYEPRPRTWTMVNEILKFWQTKGVDGFRCDFAHYVPAEAWSYLIGEARSRRAGTFFMAEAYPWEGSGDPVRSLEALIQAGFDAIYHSRSYETLKEIYRGGSLDDYDREMVAVSEQDRIHYLEYLENHDERRIPSPIVAGCWSGDSGFGSQDAGYQLAPLQFLFGPGPVLLFNGQEVGERAEGATGYKGDNGRTTIFDYWRMPQFSLWVNNHRYDGAALEPEASRLRRFYRDLLALCSDPAVTGSGYWGLRYYNRIGAATGCSDHLYGFARFAPQSGRLLLVVSNFRPESAESGRIGLPVELADAAGLSSSRSLRVRLLLNEMGSCSDVVGTYARQSLVQAGFEVSVGRQACNVYAIE